jgi:hypothetical protein
MKYTVIKSIEEWLAYKKKLNEEAIQYEATFHSTDREFTSFPIAVFTGMVIGEESGMCFYSHMIVGVDDAEELYNDLRNCQG